jgi:hypothetical protein
LYGQSPQRIQWLKDFMSQAPAFHELQPLGDDKGRFLLAKPGEYYLLYCSDRRNHTLTLAGNLPYKLDVVDPWEMTVTPAGTAPAGEFSVAAPQADMAFRFTPYRPGEKLRPEARLTASVTEGTAPVEVRFGSTGDGKKRWDFGDGAASDEPNPTHVLPVRWPYGLLLTPATGGVPVGVVIPMVQRWSDAVTEAKAGDKGAQPSTGTLAGRCALRSHPPALSVGSSTDRSRRQSDDNSPGSTRRPSVLECACRREAPMFRRHGECGRSKIVPFSARYRRGTAHAITSSFNRDPTGSAG